MNNVNHRASTLTEPSDSVNERFVERALESIYSYIDLRSLMCSGKRPFLRDI